MLPIFICEDDPRQRQQLELNIRNYLITEDLDMNLVLSTDNPETLLEYLRENSEITGLYFLDVDLNHTMSGIALASKIRDFDDAGKIVFVTTHGELSYLTFTYKVEAMDYIIKDKPEEINRRVRECIDVTYKRYISDHHSRKMRFKIKVGDRIRSINYDDVMFFETSIVPHKIILHMANGQLEFYGSIKDLEEQHECLYRCHKSFVVNKNNIKSIDRSKREIEMINDETVMVSVRALRGLFSETASKGLGIGW
jgi:two-component system response regulator AgrA